MHILIIPSWYKTKNRPLHGTFFEEQARMLQKAGHQVGVFYPFAKGVSEKFAVGEPSKMEIIDDKGLPNWYIPIRYKLPAFLPFAMHLNYVWFKNQAARFFKNYIKKHGKPDIIHAHSAFVGGVAAYGISERYNIPYILTEHYTFLINHTFGDALATRFFFKKVVNTSHKAIAVSTFFQEQLLQKFTLSKEKWATVPNVVNPIFFDHFNLKTLGLPFRLFAIAHINSRKNFLLLLKAIQFVNQKTKVIVRIGGDGPEKKQLETIAKELQIEDRITFLGSINREEVKNEITTSHAHISTSQLETFGVTIIESLAMGRPVVVTDSGGPRDIVREEDGVLVKEHTPQAVGVAILQMIQNYEDYNQKEIRENCRKRFSEAAVLLQLEAIYREAIR